MERKGFRLADFSPIKDFIDHGLNRTLIDTKIRRIADIKTREALAGQKPKRDYVQVMVIILVAVIVGAIAFTIITQVMDYSTISMDAATCKGTLAACEAHLKVATGIPATPQAVAPALAG